jgi:hypothetical protein
MFPKFKEGKVMPDQLDEFLMPGYQCYACRLVLKKQNDREVLTIRQKP